MALLALLPALLSLPATLASLVEGPEHLLVAAGSPASLTCRSSLPSARTSWTRDGLPLPPSPTALLLPDGSLFLLTTSASDTGIYACSVFDSDGVFHSDPATLTIVTKNEEHSSSGLSASQDEEIREAIAIEVEREEEKKEEVAEVEEEEVHLLPPVVELATILSPGVGLVQWGSVAGARSYVVRVFAADWEVTNITVEQGVDRVRLHNLAAGVQYSASVAVVGKGGNISPFSLTSALTPSPSLAPLSPISSLPSSVWIIAIIVVVFLTVLTILGAAIILTRLRGFQKVATNQPRTAEDNHSTIWRNKRMSWVDPRWASRDTACPLTISPTNPQAALLMSDSTYDYASSGGSSYGQYKVEPGSHYAYVDVVREGGAGNTFGRAEV